MKTSQTVSVIQKKISMEKIKGCKFHCQESINRKMKQIGDKGPRFKLSVNNLLTASTPDAYSAAKSSLE